MKNLKPYYELNLSKDLVIKDNFELIDFSHKNSNITAAKTYDAAEVLHEQIISFFVKKKMGYPKVQIFCSKPGDETSIHIDGRYTVEKEVIGTPSFAINFVINGDESEMFWFYPNAEKSITVSPSGKEPFSIYENKDDMTLLDNVVIKKPTLVRIDIPHQVKNYGNKIRWAISLRFPYYKSTWEEVVQQFDELIIQ